MKKYSVYLFDFDYTLADSSRGIVICFRNVLERHGHTGITDEAIKRTIGKTLEDSFSLLTGITAAETLAAYKAEYVKEADVHMTTNTIFFPETVHTLTTLKEDGAKIGIISTKYRYRIREMLDQHFPADFFDIIVGGEDVRKAKPDPQGIRKALRRLHRMRKETLYIGDSTVDAEAAQRAKVDFVGVLNGMTTREELAAYPHRQILNDLSLLPLVDKYVPYAPHKHFLGRILYSSPFIRKVVAFYRLLHQKQIRGKGEIKANTNPCTCRNCNTTFIGNVCPHCGQSRDTPRFTIRNAFQNILSGFFNIDDGFSRNLLELLYRPGYMIRDYMKGKRVHYFKPFQTLFVLAALYIMAVQLIDPEAIRKSEETDKETPTLASLVDGIRLHQEQATDSCTKYYLGQSITYADSARLYKKRMNRANATASLHKKNSDTGWDDESDASDDLSIAGDFMEAYSDIANGFNELTNNYFTGNSFFTAVSDLMKSWIHGNKAFSILALLPLFTIGTRLSFRRTPVGRRMNLTENFFTQVYIACQILWVSLLVLPFTGKAHLNDVFDLSNTAIFFLFVWDNRQLFGLSWGKSLWRTFLMFFFVLLSMIAICAIAIGVIVLVSYIVQWCN